MNGNDFICFKGYANRLVNNFFNTIKFNPEVIKEANKHTKELTMDRNEALKLYNKHQWKRMPYQGKIDFQKEGILRGLQGNYINAMQQGLGKSFQCLSIFNILKENNLVDLLVIVCKNSLKYNWKEEIDVTCNHKNIFIVEKDKPDDILTYKSVDDIIRKRLMNIDIIILNHESIETEDELKNLVKKKRVMLIGDESHWYKNTRADATKMLRKLTPKCHRIILNTGTVISKDLDDLFAQMNIIGAPIFPTQREMFNHTFKEFDKIIKGHNIYGKYKEGASEYIFNEANKYILRYSKQECIDIPPKNYILKKFETKDKVDIDDINSGFLSLGDYTNELTRLSKFKSKQIEPIVQEYIDKAKNKKVIIWTSYAVTAKSIYTKLKKKYNCILYIGGVNNNVRMTDLNSFRYDPNIQIAIITYKAGREGLNLTECNTAIFCDLSFDMIDIIQAEDRINRIGQDSPQNIIIMAINDSIDTVIFDNLQKKYILLNKLYGNNEKLFCMNFNLLKTKEE